jgi:predicted DNA-binding protein with PD1-like motif
MKIVLQDDRRYILRFDKGEEVVTGLQKFLSEQAMGPCAFFGVGACAEAELGYFNQHLKDYRKKLFIEDMEIIAFTGNGSLADGKPVIHAHGSFGRNDFTQIGGHIFKLTVSVTCEIFLIKLEGALERKLNPDFNLNLFV